MNCKLAILASCLIAIVFLAGCEGGGNFLGLQNSSVNNDVVGANLPGADNSDEANDGFGDLSHLPEPATVTLLGSGLLAYALFKLRKKRQ